MNLMNDFFKEYQIFSLVDSRWQHTSALFFFSIVNIICTTSGLN